MVKLKYLAGAIFMLKWSLLYPVDYKSSPLKKWSYFTWGFLFVSSFVTIFLQCVIYLCVTPFNLIDEAMIIMNTDNQVEQITMEQSSKLSDKFAYFWTTSCVVSSLAPTISSLAVGNGSLPILAWFPYDHGKSPQFEITYIWQVFCLINLGTIYAVLDFIFPCITILMRQQFKILATLLENNVDENIVAQFIKYCEDINYILSTFLMGKISAAIFNTLFMAFSLITTGNQAMIFGLSTYVISTTTELFIYTYSGQILTENADFLWTLYDCPWYLCNIEFQKLFYIVQIRISKIIYTRAGNYFSMHAPSFITFLKALCSYVALLKELTDRQN
ncbi:odorant receptor 22c [Asbolus verrucosus]|uniref:Odorant receptor 22c n=1 Tax=Asbolus verrucosus TaxID=1661398 RepID=A0A482WAT1_ASBVE|nr:odorant receptor 22c [Asbolus verrucosus]